MKQGRKMWLGGIADGLAQSGLWDWHECLVYPETKDGTEHVEYDNTYVSLEGHIEKCPPGHVFDAQHASTTSLPAGHWSHAQMHMFSMFSVSPPPPDLLNLEIIAIWADFWCYLACVHELPTLEPCPDGHDFVVRCTSRTLKPLLYMVIRINNKLPIKPII